VVCFHGYDESGESFDILTSLIPGDYSILAIDLPFHGKTTWNAHLAFDNTALSEIILKIRLEYFEENANFSVIGFSMGGRMALSLFRQCPAQVERLILLAPDGLKMNFWYWLATQTVPGKFLFKYSIKNPGWFFYTLNFANKTRIINQSVYKFTRFYLHQQALREQLFDRWINMRLLKPDVPMIRQLIRDQKIPVYLVYGQYDRIMKPGAGRQFSKTLEQHCKVQVIPTGHQLLQEKNAKILLPLFKMIFS
jgi:pimeloyl-ACP methyl ester carboxylesterase